MFDAVDVAAETVTEAVMLAVPDVALPVCGMARTDVASTPKAIVMDDSVECIFTVVWRNVVGARTSMVLL